MELIHMYIKNFNNIIMEQEINLSNNFHVELKDNKLVIKDKKNKIEGFYGENINNITMLLGKNGVGKTSTLDILGMQRRDRSQNDNYVLIYSIGEEKFIIECCGEEILLNIENINMDKGTKNYIKSHSPIGVVLEREHDSFNYCEIVPNYSYINEHNYSYINEHINFVYITRNINERLKSNTDIYDSKVSPYMCSRVYKEKFRSAVGYKYLHQMRLNENLNFNNKNFNIEISCKIDDYSNLDLDKYIPNDADREKIVNLKKQLYFYDDIKRFNKFKSLKKFFDDNIDEEYLNYSEKYKYVLDFLSRYILDSFINGIYTNQLKKGTQVKIEDHEFYSFLEEFTNDKLYIDSENILMGAYDKSLELDYFEKAMDYFSSKDVDIHIKLIYIGRYLHSRIDTLTDIGKDGHLYQTSVEEFVEKLLNIDGTYFINNKLVSNLNIYDKEIESILEVYDKYTSRKDEIADMPGDNNLNLYIKINFNGLSEGERAFFAILTQIFEEIKYKTYNDLTVFLIDEPDQALHPEWSRMFIKYISDEMKKYSTHVQFIITTHSPFMVSDLTSENVYLLQKNAENYISINRLSNYKELHNTFGSNVYDILKTSFILDRTMGEFAYNKIRTWIKKLYDNDINDINEEYIDLIGEKVIRNKLKQMYNQQKSYEYNEKNEILKIVNQELDPQKVKKMLENVKNISEGK
ncbi:AAA family ATPase [Paraclostridium bifermentans]|uniref:AAA family ATPase n=1 Tax=Paraclostridium bifermentans TaxID=1490 RepID=UPI0024B8AA09|nr:AAA family ATPase [Paraclostridium bifermentans]